MDSWIFQPGLPARDGAARRRARSRSRRSASRTTDRGRERAAWVDPGARARARPAVAVGDALAAARRRRRTVRRPRRRARRARRGRRGLLPRRVPAGVARPPARRGRAANRSNGSRSSTTCGRRCSRATRPRPSSWRARAASRRGRSRRVAHRHRAPARRGSRLVDGDALARMRAEIAAIVGPDDETARLGRPRRRRPHAPAARSVDQRARHAPPTTRRRSRGRARSTTAAGLDSPAAGVPLQPGRPVPVAAARRGEGGRPPGGGVAVGGLQVAQQDAPGHPVDDQVVHGEQELGGDVRARSRRTGPARPGPR